MAAKKKAAKKQTNTINLEQMEKDWLKTRDTLVKEYEKAAQKSKKEADAQRRQVKSLRKKKKTLSTRVQNARKRLTKSNDKDTKKALNTVSKEANSIGEELKKAATILSALTETQKSMVVGAKRFAAINKALVKAESDLNKPRKKRRRVKKKVA